MNPSPLAATPAPSAFARSLPADLSHAPKLGIIGVFLGAGVVTLAGRLLSLGLADLKGSVGIGFDHGAWIGSAFNAALVFIGPLTVYLGGLLGARRVLLICAGIFTVVSAVLPLAHSYSLLLALLAIAGLSAGTFYPLTLTFALRSLPLRYLPLTLAIYASCIEGAVNFAPSLYGSFHDHLSWRWMFWAPAIITPVMMACIRFGMPSSKPPQRTGPAPSFAGFLYASAGFGLVYVALDQGQRLDWWRSGIFTALFVGGVFFLLCALLRRIQRPNPLVDLPYLRQRNTQLLALMLFAFRFALLATILVIPQSLGARGFDSTQIGPAILGTAIAEMVVTFVGAYFLMEGLDPRLLMAIGFACIGLAACLNADFSSSWSAANFFRTELLMAVGQSFAFIGLVSSLLLQAFFSGGMEAPQRVLTFSAFFHTVRLVGGQIGVVWMVHFMGNREKLHSNLLGLHVQSGEWVTDGTLRSLASALNGRSNGLAAATGRAVGIVNGRVRLEAFSLTFIDSFHLIAWACVLTLLLIAFMRRAPMNLRELGRLQSAPDASREVKL